MVTNSIGDGEWEEGLEEGALISGTCVPSAKPANRFVVEGEGLELSLWGLRCLWTPPKLRKTRPRAVAKDLDEATQREYTMKKAEG